jgi:hypothetical protein
MWRRGPGVIHSFIYIANITIKGRGTLCNACGVKWAMKFKRRNGKRSDDEIDHSAYDRTNYAESKISAQQLKLKTPSNESKNELKEHYCKYCNTSWPVGFFKNTQQFGAHCSNCSRKHRGGKLSLQVARTNVKCSGIRWNEENQARGVN